jgi:hypothetical protein
MQRSSHRQTQSAGPPRSARTSQNLIPRARRERAKLEIVPVALFPAAAARLRRRGRAATRAVRAVPNVIMSAEVALPRRSHTLEVPRGTVAYRNRERFSSRGYGAWLRQPRFVTILASDPSSVRVDYLACSDAGAPSGIAGWSCRAGGHCLRRCLRPGVASACCASWPRRLDRDRELVRVPDVNEHGPREHIAPEQRADPLLCGAGGLDRGDLKHHVAEHHADRVQRHVDAGTR